MKTLSIYISLLFFVACMLAPSVMVISHRKAKETKVVKLFDMEDDDDTRDADSETEKEKEIDAEKLFGNFLTGIALLEFSHHVLVHYHFYQYSLSEPIRELITPPPRV